MAGAILISESARGWSVAGLTFEVVADLTRSEFSMAERDVVAKIYMSMDDGFDCLSLMELDRKDFNCFYHHTKTAFLRCQGEGCCANAEFRIPDDFYDGIMNYWAELLCKLEADERFEGKAGNASLL